MPPAITALPDLSVRWEAAYRGYLSVTDAWLSQHAPDENVDADLYLLCEQDVIHDAMDCIFAGITGSYGDPGRVEVVRGMPFGQSAWLRAAKLATSVLGLRSNYRPPWLMRSGGHIVTFHRCALSSAYARQRGVRPILLTYADWFQPGGQIDDAATPGLSEAMEAVLREAYAVAWREAGLSNASNASEFIRRTQRLARRMDYHRHWLRRHAARMPAEFWSASMGNPLNRLFARAVRRAGGRVVGFDHGCGTGMWDCDFQVRLEFPFVNQFVTFGHAMAQGLARNSIGVTRPLNQVNIHPMPQTLTAPSVPVGRASPASRIVYIPSSQSGHKFISPPLYADDVMAAWQRSLFGALAQRGYSSAIKPHPESGSDSALDLRRDFGIEIISGDFEALPHAGNIMVFDCPQTTAFRHALLSGAPVVLIDLPRLSLQPEARELLERRVAFVRGRIDATGNIDVDWNEFDQAIKRAGRLVDAGVARDFFGAVAATSE